MTGKKNHQKSESKTPPLAAAFVGGILGCLGTVLAAFVNPVVSNWLGTAATDEMARSIAVKLATKPSLARAIIDFQEAHLYDLPESFIAPLRKPPERQRPSLPNHPTMAAIEDLSEDGWYYFLQGDSQQAIEIYEECLNFLKHATPQNPELYADIAKRYGQALRKQSGRDAEGKLKEACRVYAEATECDSSSVRVKIQSLTCADEKSGKLSETLNDLALVYRTKAELDLAVEFYNLSDAIATQCMPDSSAYEQHGWNQNGLGLISLRQYYKDQNRSTLAVASEHFVEAEKVFRNQTGSHFLGQALNHRALVDYLNGDYEKAIAKLSLVTNIWRDSFGSLSKDLELSYRNLGRVYDALAKRSDSAHKPKHNENAKDRRFKADAIAKRRNQGFSIRVVRGAEVYSTDGHDEWESAVAPSAVPQTADKNEKQ